MNWRRDKKKLGIGGVVVLFIVIFFFWSLSKEIEIIDKVNRLPRSDSQKYRKRKLNEIMQIVVHHSASSGQRAEDYARYHVHTKGWAGIGYHFVIEKDGRIMLTNYLDTISHHLANQNTKSIGICLSGNFQIEEPSKAQIKSLGKLIHYLRNRLPQPLAVIGHKDKGETSCPGHHLYKQLKRYQLA